jgi:hypothetical protein
VACDFLIFDLAQPCTNKSSQNVFDRIVNRIGNNNRLSKPRFFGYPRRSSASKRSQRNVCAAQYKKAGKVPQPMAWFIRPCHQDKLIHLINATKHNTAHDTIVRERKP